MKQHGGMVRALVNSGAAIVLCGNAKKMPVDVRNQLIAILASAEPHEAVQRTRADAEAFVRQMEQRGVFQSETW